MLGVIVGAAVLTKVIKTVKANSESASFGNNRNVVRNPGIRIGIDSDNVAGKNYQVLIRELINRGYSNISTNEIREQRKGLFNKDINGRVRSLSVNGFTDFDEDDIFPPDARICVSFEVFKDSPSVIIPELEKLAADKRRLEGNTEDKQKLAKLAAENVRLAKLVEEKRVPQKILVTPPAEEERFCEYCDCILAKGWTECHHCGAPVTRRTRK